MKELVNEVSVPVGRGVLGRLLNAKGESIDGRGSIVDVSMVQAWEILRGEGNRDRDGVLETGIKVVDLLAPVRRGGTARIAGDFGVGKQVLLNEIIHNMAWGHSGVTVLVGAEGWPGAARETLLQLREAGLSDEFVWVFSESATPLKELHRALITGLTIGSYFRDREEKQVVLVLNDDMLGRAAWQFAQKYIGVRGKGSITCLLISTDEVAGSRRKPVGTETEIVFSRSRYEKRLLPAVDPLASRSPGMPSAGLSKRHAEIASQVRDSLERYDRTQGGRDHLPQDKLPDKDRITISRTRKILNFLTQPFFAAQIYTGVPGAYVPLKETIAGARKILRGECDKVAEEAFYMVGTIEQVAEEAKTK